MSPESLDPKPKRRGMQFPLVPFGQRLRYAWTILRRHFGENMLLLRTAALTYATLLSSVPFLAVLLSLLRAFDVEDRVLPVLVQQLRIGGDQPVEVLLSTAERLNPAALGGLGVVGLLFSAVLLMAQVDGAFNAIWGVRENRSLMRRLANYGGLLVIGPLWIALWSTGVSSLKLALSAWPAEFSFLVHSVTRLAGSLLVFLVLTALIRLTPNTRVRILPAMAGAAIATGLLEISQTLFVNWIKSSVAYDIVYGAFAALPIFFAWIYLNWLVVLLGVEASYLVQHVPTWLREAAEPHAPTWEEREQLTLASAALLSVSETPMAVEELAEKLSVSGRFVQHPLDNLVDMGYVTSISDPRSGPVAAYQAMPSLRRLSLSALRRELRALRPPATSREHDVPAGPMPEWVAILKPLMAKSDDAFGEWTTEQLAEALAAKRNETAPARTSRGEPRQPASQSRA